LKAPTLVEIAAAVAMLFALLVSAYQAGYLVADEERTWRNFAGAHRCKIVSKSLERTGWRCSDGITYYRRSPF
jgi:hypothetical protein